VKEIRFERDGVHLYAVESGAGRPIILLHGGLADHRAARMIAGPLDAQFRVITPDLRGSGRSIYRGELSWADLADDVAALARHLGLDRVVVGGISAGAATAMTVALRHPALIDALVVLHPAFGGADLGLAPAAQAAMAAMDALGARAPAEGIEVLLPLFAALPDAIRDRARALIATFDPGSVAATTRFLASGAQPFASAAELAAITAPTLIVPGLDPTHPAELADRFARHIRNATVRVIPAPSPWAVDFATAIAELLRSDAARTPPDRDPGAPA
jgi:3-oxoadipate enol-lactonase